MDGAVGYSGEGGVVGHDYEGLAQGVAEAGEQFLYLVAVSRVEATGWLVGEYDARIVDKGTCHGGALTLAARQLGRLVLTAVGQSEQVQQFVGATQGLGATAAGGTGR